MEDPTKLTKHDESIGDILIVSILLLCLLSVVILIGIF